MIKLKITTSLFLVFLLIPNLAFAESQYGSMDVYYNEKLLPGKEVAKPILDIGETFKVKVNLTVYQKSDVYISLSCMEKSSFEIINGPTLKIEDYSKGDILEANSSKEYEWIVKPTERWKGGSIPLDIYYTILAHGDSEPLAEGGFTVAYCTISNEYYKGEIPTSEEQPASETEPSSTSASAPAFSLVSAISVLALSFALFRR
jgi:MAST domain-containing protein